MKKNTNKQIIGITLTLIILTISIGNEILTPPQTVNASPNDIFASDLSKDRPWTITTYPRTDLGQLQTLPPASQISFKA